MKKVFLTSFLVALVLGAFGETTKDETKLTDGTVPQTILTANGVGSMVDLTVPSAVETLYSRFTANLAQFGYGTFIGALTQRAARNRTPEPYLLGLGDQLTVQVWGDPVDLGDLVAQYTTTVNGNGTFFYPAVGQVRADGILRADAEKTLITAMAQKYKRFELRLLVNPGRVFPMTVSGLVATPGTVLVDPWTSLPDVLAQVGGIKKNGTLRNLRLIKADGRETSIDLYDLLVRATKPVIKLEEGDVLWVGPIGKTVALFGEVKVPSIFELKPAESMADLLVMAGGPLPSANGAPLNRVTWQDGTWVKTSVVWDEGSSKGILPRDGDAFWFDGPTDVKTSLSAQAFVKVGGEVGSPGFVEWKVGMTLENALTKSGGVLDSGFLPGLSLVREDVAKIQKVQIEAAIQSNSAQVSLIQARLAGTTDPVVLAALIQEVTARTEAGIALKTSLTNGSLGRILLDDASKTDQIALQPGDSITVPRQNGVVMLLGEVFNSGAQVWKAGMTVKGALDAVGGVTPSGNWDGIYVMRTSGRVDSVASRGAFLWFNPLLGDQLSPGDIVYIPTKRGDDTRSWSVLKDVIAMISQTTSTGTNVFLLLRTLGMI